MFAALALAIAFASNGPELVIVYRDVGGTPIKADFYPAAIKNKDGDPFVLVIHGGAWIGGKREDMSALCEGLAKANISSATISYRLAPGSKWPAQLDDCQAAVRYFRANAGKYNIRPDRIAAMGASAGGHLSLLLGFTDTRDKLTLDNPLVSSRVQAVVNFFGPVDLSKDFPEGFANYLSVQVTGKPYNVEDELLKSFSPYFAINESSAPVFTIHGDKDAVVPFKQAERLDEALKKANVFHELRRIPGMGHEIDVKNPECVNALTDAVKFLNRQLAPASVGR